MGGGAAGAGAWGSGGAIGDVISRSITVEDIAPGDEDTVCVTHRLSNAAPLRVVEVRGFIDQGSHHMIVDRSRFGDPSTEPRPCADLQGDDDTRMLIAQQKETVFALPEGTAYTLAPHQYLTLEMHYFNSSRTTLDATGTIELVLADPEARDLAEVTMAFTGNPIIALNPHERASVVHYAPMEGSASSPAQVFALTSHTHQLGVRATIERAASKTAAGVLLHESLDWSEPPLDRFEPPLAFAGGDGLRLTCEYDNSTSRLVTFGTGFDDEMCFMWLYWFRR